MGLGEMLMRYQSGFANHFATRRCPARFRKGAIRRSAAPYGLYAEQFSGTAFTAPRMPTGVAGCTASAPRRSTSSSRPHETRAFTNRFDEMPPDAESACAGTHCRCRSAADRFHRRVWHPGRQWIPRMRSGCAIHWYVANRSMPDRFFYDADGELLIVPQQGRLRVATELGVLEVRPLEIAVIPRGAALSGRASGRHRARLCVRELRRAVAPAGSGPDRLQRAGQSARLQTPVAAYEDREGSSNSWRSSAAGCGRRRMDHSPLDVVAWHGNNAPYKYDLRRFNTIGSVSFDHPGSLDLPGAAIASATRRASTTSTS